MKYLPFVLDFFGAFLAYTLWSADLITLWGVAAIIVITAIGSTYLGSILKDVS